MKNSLLLLTGWGSTHHVWDRIIPALLTSDQIVNVIPPWMANSQIGASLGDLDNYVDTLAASISTPRDIIAWSMGGLIAIRLANRHPACVNKLVFISSSPQFVDPASTSTTAIDPHWFSDFRHQFQRQPEKTLRRFQSMLVAGDKHAREVLRHLRSEAQVCDFDFNECRLGLDLLEQDFRQDLISINHPFCFIQGLNDSVLNAHAIEVFSQQIHAELILLEATGHVPQLSDPELLAAHIKCFLQ